MMGGLAASTARAAAPTQAIPAATDPGPGTCSDSGPSQELVFVRCGGRQVAALVDPHGRVGRRDVCSRMFEELLVALGDGVSRSQDPSGSAPAVTSASPPTMGVLPRELPAMQVEPRGVRRPEALADPPPALAAPPPEPPPRA